MFERVLIIHYKSCWHIQYCLRYGNYTDKTRLLVGGQGRKIWQKRGNQGKSKIRKTTFNNKLPHRDNTIKGLEKNRWIGEKSEKEYIVNFRSYFNAEVLFRSLRLRCYRGKNFSGGIGLIPISSRSSLWQMFFKICLLNNFVYSQENTCVGVSLQ